MTCGLAATEHWGRTDCHLVETDSVAQARRGHALEYSQGCRRQWHLEIDGAPRVSDVRDTTPSRRSFKLSTDPFFIEKVRGHRRPVPQPADHALVLCVYERRARFRL